MIEIALKRGNRASGASVIEMAEAEYMVSAQSYIQGIDDILALPTGIIKDGVSITINDVAQVVESPLMRRGIAELNGNGETVGGIIVMRYGENAKSTIDAVKAKLDSLKASLPKGVNIVPVYDRSTLIDKSVDTLTNKLVEELLVVGLVCAIFLFHIRSSMVALISLPIGILAAFIVMKLQGLNANIVSLVALLAAGAMVDGAIVVVENLHKHIHQHAVSSSQGASAVKGIQRVKGFSKSGGSGTSRKHLYQPLRQHLQSFRQPNVGLRLSRPPKLVQLYSLRSNYNGILIPVFALKRKKASFCASFLPKPMPWQQLRRWLRPWFLAGGLFCTRKNTI